MSDIIFNSIKNISDDNFSLYNLYEDEKENLECPYFQDIYYLKNNIFLEQNNKIFNELLPTCDYSNEISKVFPIKSEINLADNEKEISEDKKLLQRKNENSNKDSINSINTLTEKDEQNLEENINISNSYIIDIIKNELIQNGFSSDITDKIKGKYITNKDIRNIFKLKEKQKKEKDKITIDIHKNIIGNKRGRKNQNESTNITHDKNIPDNILKKCKRILFDKIIVHANSCINTYKSNHEEYFELEKLNYKKYINNLKKEKEMELFNMKIKDFVSLEISAKSCWKFNKNYNKNIMKKLLEEEKDNEIINSFLNMTFGEWIDIFTLKRKLNDNLNFNGLRDALDKLSKENDEYFTRFIFYLFNYKNAFENKVGRNSKKSKENKNAGMIKDINE